MTITKVPLFRSPPGMVWATGDMGGTAHLLADALDWHNSPVVCGAETPRRLLAFQAGGYGQRPCYECVSRVWERVMDPKSDVWEALEEFK